MAAGTDTARRSDGLFSVRAVLGIGWVTLTSVVFCNLVIKLFDRQLLDAQNVLIPRYWPISKFALRVTRLPLPDAAVFTALALVVFAVAVVVLLRTDHLTLLSVVVAGGALLVLTTLTHGVGPGILRPLSAPGNYERAAIDIFDPGGYYLAAIDVADPVRFLETFESQQLSLPLHAQTHPPGAVLTFYVLDTILPSALWVSLVVGLGSLALTALLLSRLLRTYYPASVANYTTFLFVLLPAVQVYTLTSLDAMITVVMLAAVYCFTRDSPLVAALGTLVCVFVASTQTFTFVFILPVLGVLALARREKWLPFVVVLVGLVAAYALLAVGFDFDYLHSFSLASDQQNTEGFLPFVSPLRYLYTRIENVAEIALFFTPFLCLLAVRGVRVLWRSARAGGRVDREPLLLFGGAVLSLGGLFLGSVYHTGETARGALFVYPFLLVPVAAVVRAADATTRRRAVLAAAVFGQALFMQLIGDYWW
ncbi:hypothetical protein [Halococcus hamelinensis]|uniref:Glycosyltransferase RgtA/B/C/D-like domain-containing protein n=1 Tax=Halococcus hamelinensis 100A6 TaxID=1132509 RepID=M0M1B6_9EURY|nr:hypothetical protein [Halococcus hamelinensis]EMA38399.1 hypothetical protein C447_09592 [Halococcus hamelinensis 100A6]